MSLLVWIRALYNFGFVQYSLINWTSDRLDFSKVHEKTGPEKYNARSECKRHCVCMNVSSKEFHSNSFCVIDNRCHLFNPMNKI